MRNELNFNYNWNNKLSGTFFTTLRMKDDNRFRIGETHTILLNKKPIFTADIVAIRSFLLKDINEFVAGLDTGYNAEECRKMIRTMYKNQNIDWDKRYMSLILFRKNKTSVDSFKQSHSEQASA
jgi:hypothetical protein